MSFVHLHTHSHYSLLDGLAKIDELVNEAVKNQMPALALTDHGNLYGAIEFYKSAQKSGIKPIIGVEFYLAPRTLYQKEIHTDSKPFHLVVLAKSEKGYRNLLKLVSISHLKGFYYKPRIDKEILAKHSQELIGLSACMAGELSRLILNDQKEKAKKTALEYEEIFGKNNFFIEIGYHPNIPNYDLVKKELIQIANELKIPLVATQDIHYIHPRDAIAQDALIAIQTNTYLNDTNRLSMRNDDYSFRTAEKMTSLFKEIPNSIKNTLEIAQKCNLELEFGKWIFPKFKIPGQKTAEEYLKELALLGLKSKNLQNNKKAVERMNYELEIINKKGYAPYFLIVADFVNWAKKRKIITNTRGSAAGSFVSYLIGISNIDPLKYDLPFERFLNPYRPSPPDIDIDFADDRRDEVIEYAKQRYGHEKVAQIGTFGTMMARAAVRDITRVLNYNYATGDRIAKMIPFGSQGFPMTIKKALEINPELKEAYEKEPQTKEILDLAQKIEGSARHVSVHAAGVVIAPDNLTNYIPLQYEPKGEKIITQFDMRAVEAIGLLKMDFLGVRNLSILGKTIELIKEYRGENINLEKIPLDDPKTFKLLAKGETVGLFQLSGGGMTKYLKELKPTNLTDIMAMIALFRPGPMANIPTYIRRKHGKEPIRYLDPRLEKVIGKTYGVITFQEDILLIAIELAGYDWGSVDKFRKAIGKKIPREMAAQEKTFIEGCQKYGKLSKEKAEALWKLFEPFKGYGFNKAHAASYAMIAYQTAFLKANYPSEFMTAVLSAEAGDMDKIAEIINECKRLKIKVLPPDINESYKDFTLIKSEKGDKIRFGLQAIKNVGHNVVKAIIEERTKNGPFTSLENLLERLPAKDLNKKSLESLIKAGALDKLGERNRLLFNLEKLIDYHKETTKNNHFLQSSLFSLSGNIKAPELKLKEIEPMKFEEKLKFEKELLGLYISGHPLDKYKKAIAKNKFNLATIKKFRNQTPIITMAMVEQIKKILTKNGEPMAFIKLIDLTDSIEAVAFPSFLNSYGHLLEEDSCLIIKGRINIRNNEPTIICEEAKDIKEMVNNNKTTSANQTVM